MGKGSKGRIYFVTGRVEVKGGPLSEFTSFIVVPTPVPCISVVTSRAGVCESRLVHDPLWTPGLNVPPVNTGPDTDLDRHGVNEWYRERERAHRPDCGFEVLTSPRYHQESWGPPSRPLRLFLSRTFLRGVRVGDGSSHLPPCRPWETGVVCLSPKQGFVYVTKPKTTSPRRISLLKNAGSFVLLHEIPDHKYLLGRGFVLGHFV